MYKEKLTHRKLIPSSLTKAVTHKLMTRNPQQNTNVKETNCITWNVKQQIKHLHESDSTYWTPTCLSHSFNASIEIIHSILASKWKPLNEEALLKHDKDAILQKQKLNKQKGISSATVNVYQMIRDKEENGEQCPFGLKTHLLKQLRTANDPFSMMVKPGTFTKLYYKSISKVDKDVSSFVEKKELDGTWYDESDEIGKHRLSDILDRIRPANTNG
ncbi:hypothetical protein GJ496_003903 [Pomphorhynchus laevis]|nr:hypothetical protein GJ496_003903 [Pomphorhynchus laevis]